MKWIALADGVANKESAGICQGDTKALCGTYDAEIFLM